MSTAVGHMFVQLSSPCIYFTEVDENSSYSGLMVDSIVFGAHELRQITSIRF